MLTGSLVGRLLMGWLADRFPKKYVMLLIYGLVAATVPLLYLAPTIGSLRVAAVLFGIGLGGDYMIIPLMAAELYGLKILGRVMGVVLTADGVAEALVPMGVAAMRDATGSYGGGFALLVGLATLGARCGGLPATRDAPAARVRRFVSRRRLRVTGPASALVLVASARDRRRSPDPTPRSLPVVEIVNDGAARGEMVLTIDLPRGMPGDTLQLRDEDGDVIAAAGRLSIVGRRSSCAGSAAQEHRRLTIEPALDRRPRAIVEATRRPDRVEIVDRSAAGRGLPGRCVAGSSLARQSTGACAAAAICIRSSRHRAGSSPTTIRPNHLHHHGIWSAWAESHVRRAAPGFLEHGRGQGHGAVRIGSLETWSGVGARRGARASSLRRSRHARRQRRR